MKRFLFLLVIMATAVLAQDAPLEVTAPGNVRLVLAIPAPVPLQGAADPAVAKEVEDVLRFDMDLAGPFSLMSEGLESRGIRPGDFDFGVWKASGAKLLVKSGYVREGDRLTLEFRLYDVIQEKMLAARRLSGKPGDLRRMTHTFSDEIMKAVTGQEGPFSGKIVFVSTRSGSKEIHLMDFDGHGVRKITGNGSINLYPEFFPNGKEIVYTSYRNGNPDLYRRELFSGAETKVSSRKGLNAMASVAPSGDRIALTLSKDGNSEIYVLAKDGKILSRLTQNHAIEVSPTWSPDGSRIAFVSDRLGKPQIFSMKSDGTDARRVTLTGSYNVSPRWSPRGDRIVYASREGGVFQIHIVNPDGTGDTVLTSRGNNEHPRWSPDGRFITFSSKRDGSTGIFLMRSDGTGEIRISGQGDTHPAWSPRW